MKKINFALAASCMLALAATNNTFAQNNLTAMLSSEEKAFSFDNLPKTVNVSVSIEPSVNAKAKKNFLKDYKTATNESWEETKDGFAAEFTKDEKKTIVFYNKKGNWQASLVKYTGDKLPEDIRDNVMREYKNYTITYVDEVLTPESRGEITYIVHLENPKYLKLIRYREGEMDVYRDYNK